MLKQAFKLAYVELFRDCGREHAGPEGLRLPRKTDVRRPRNLAEPAPRTINLVFCRPEMAKSDERSSTKHSDLAFSDNTAIYEEVYRGETNPLKTYTSIDALSEASHHLFPEVLADQVCLLPRLLNFNFGTTTYLTN